MANNDSFDVLVEKLRTVHLQELEKGQREAEHWRKRASHDVDAIDRIEPPIDPDGHVGFGDGWGNWVGVMSDPRAGLVRIVSRNSDGTRNAVAFMEQEEGKLIDGLRAAFAALKERKSA